MKNFTVNIGGQSMTLPGPDDGTQEQAQAEAERQFQAKQAADVNKDFSGATGRAGIAGTGLLGGDTGALIGRTIANFAQGGAELVGGPAQLAGATPGPRYQQAEKEPQTPGDMAARFAGATLPLSPLGALAAGTKVIPGAATTVAGAPATRVGISTIPAVLGGATVPRAVGAVEGASAPANSRTERAANTAIGALTGGFGRGASSTTQSALDRLAGMAAGSLFGHHMGGGGLGTIIGAGVGGSAGHAAHEALAGLLHHFPPSVVARAIASWRQGANLLGAEGGNQNNQDQTGSR